MAFIGTQEILMIIVVALVVLGPKRIPEVAKTIGKGLGYFKKARDKVKTDLDESGALKEINEIKNTVQEAIDSVKPLTKVDLMSLAELNLGETPNVTTEPEASYTETKHQDPFLQYLAENQAKQAIQNTDKPDYLQNLLDQKPS